MPVTVTIDFVGLFLFAVHDQRLHVVLPMVPKHGGVHAHVAYLDGEILNPAPTSLANVWATVVARGAPDASPGKPFDGTLPTALIDISDITGKRLPPSALQDPPAPVRHTGALLTFDLERTPVQLICQENAEYDFTPKAGPYNGPKDVGTRTQLRLTGLPHGEAFARAFDISGAIHAPDGTQQPFTVGFSRLPEEDEQVTLLARHIPEHHVGKPAERPTAGARITHLSAYYAGHGVNPAEVPVPKFRRPKLTAMIASEQAKLKLFGGSTETCPNGGTKVGGS